MLLLRQGDVFHTGLTLLHLVQQTLILSSKSSAEESMIRVSLCLRAR